MRDRKSGVGRKQEGEESESDGNVTVIGLKFLGSARDLYTRISTLLEGRGKGNRGVYTEENRRGGGGGGRGGERESNRQFYIGGRYRE